MTISHESLHTYAASIVDIFEERLEVRINGQTYIDLEKDLYNVLQRFIPAINDAYLKGYERGCKNAPKPESYSK